MEDDFRAFVEDTLGDVPAKTGPVFRILALRSASRVQCVASRLSAVDVLRANAST
jgi:hypothetical protein